MHKFMMRISVNCTHQSTWATWCWCSIWFICMLHCLCMASLHTVVTLILIVLSMYSISIHKFFGIEFCCLTKKMFVLHQRLSVSDLFYAFGDVNFFLYYFRCHLTISLPSFLQNVVDIFVSPFKMCKKIRLFNSIPHEKKIMNEQHFSLFNWSLKKSALEHKWRVMRYLYVLLGFSFGWLILCLQDIFTCVQPR